MSRCTFCFKRVKVLPGTCRQFESDIVCPIKSELRQGVVVGFDQTLVVRFKFLLSIQNIATAVFVKPGVDAFRWIGRSAPILFP